MSDKLRHAAYKAYTEAHADYDAAQANLDEIDERCLEALRDWRESEDPEAQRDFYALDNERLVVKHAYDAAVERRQQALTAYVTALEAVS